MCFLCSSFIHVCKIAYVCNCGHVYSFGSVKHTIKSSPYKTPSIPLYIDQAISSTPLGFLINSVLAKNGCIECYILQKNNLRTSKYVFP